MTPENFGLHSLRSGGASAAANNGISDRLMSKQGRWSSEKARNGYIKDSVVKRLTSQYVRTVKTFKVVKKKISDSYFLFSSPITNQYNSPKIYCLFYTLVWQVLIRTEIKFATAQGKLEIVFRPFHQRSNDSACIKHCWIWVCFNLQ